MANWHKNPLKKLSEKSIGIQVIYLELFLTTMGLIMLFIVYRGFSDQLLRRNTDYIENIVYQKQEVINDHLSDVANIMAYSTYSDEIQDLLLSETSLEIFDHVAAVDDYITQLTVIDEKIAKMILYNDQVRYNFLYKGYEADILFELMDKIDKSTKPQYLGTIVVEGVNHLAFGNTIYDQDSVMKDIGKMVVLIDSGFIVREMTTDVGEYYLIEDSGKIVVSYDESQIGEMVDEDAIDMKVDEWELSSVNVALVMTNASNNSLPGINQMWVLFAWIVFIMVMVIIGTYAFFSSNAVVHLQRISQFVATISHGDLRNLKKRLTLDGPKEIQAISYEINDLLDEVNQLTSRLLHSTSNLYEAEISKKEAELSFLRSQINPHFLYNTLGVVKGIANLHNEEEIEWITGALVRIFKYSIKGEDLVELFQEMDIVEAYVKIQSIRFDNRFSVTYEIEAHLMDVRMLKMMLQPLLENAIQHGIEPSYKQSHIIVRAKETTEFVILSVEDDGVGMSDATVEDINKRIVDADEQGVMANDAIGLLNVHRRLKHFYGEQAGLKVRSEIGKGTQVSIFIPSDRLD